MKKQQLVGGQAIIEGVMMKGENHTSFACRNPDGQIITETRKTPSITKKHKFLGLPFIRGIVILIEMMIIGTKALLWSANHQLKEDDKETELSSISLVITVLISLFLALLFFKLLPLWITKILFPVTGTASNQIIFNIIDGIIRILIFTSYILIIGLTKDVKRLFEYHGAEHMAVHCLEEGEELKARNILKFSTKHRRCGTSFIFIVLTIAILVFSLVPANLPFYILALIRIPLILPIAGISYELLKLSFRHQNNMILRLLTQPGIFLQNLTTSKPDISQAEVSVAALKTLLKKEKRPFKE